MKFDKEFKEAILNLPEKEKDKLLLRLLKKDLDLVNKLHFELISTNSVDDERVLMENKIITKIAESKEAFYSFGYLLMELRYLSGDITVHVKKTKDKFGEVSLNILMLTTFFELFNDQLPTEKCGKAYKIIIYIIARAFKILLLAQKLHKDYFLDLESDLMKLGNYLLDNHVIMKMCINNGFDVNWLLSIDKVPDDLPVIHKQIREAGFLR